MVEAGVSQSLAELDQISRQWLENAPTLVGDVPVNVEEFPLYITLICVMYDESELMESDDLVAQSDAHPNLPLFGPLTIQGVTCSGKDGSRCGCAMIDEPITVWAMQLYAF